MHIVLPRNTVQVKKPAWARQYTLIMPSYQGVEIDMFGGNPTMVVSPVEEKAL